MTVEIITALIASASALTLAGASYWFTKQRERDADLRREKLEHYKDFTSTLTGIIRNEATSEGQKAFSAACNKLNLIAPQPVIKALHAFQEEISVKNKDKDDNKHDQLLSNLFYEIRKDLKISPADTKETLLIRLWASGINDNLK